MQEYTICGGAGVKAVIAPDKGATVISLEKDGQEFLYRNDENLNSSERPRCGIPFLFPIFGRLKDGRYRWEGREYAMEIHGFGHTSIWQVASHEPDRLVLVLEAGEQTRAQYPFDFRVSMTFAASAAGLTITQKFENTGNAAMPYNYGFHPYFLTERAEDICVETTAEVLFDFVTGARSFGHDMVTLKMPQDAPEAGAVLMGVKAPTVLRWTDGKKLTMEFDDSFDTHVLWTQRDKPFLCVEPVNGTADGLNAGKYRVLEPGEKCEAILRLLPEVK